MATYYGIRIDGGPFITELQQDPLNLETAQRLAQELSSKPENADAVVAVVSRTPDPIGGGWQDNAAAFVNGDAIDRHDERYPS